MISYVGDELSLHSGYSVVQSIISRSPSFRLLIHLELETEGRQDRRALEMHRISFCKSLLIKYPSITTS